MGKTSLPTSESVKERFGNRHRHPMHASWNDVLESVMAIMPSYDELEDGCAYCGDPPFENGKIEETSGVIHYTKLPEEHGGGLTTSWLCSLECAAKAHEHRQTQLPREPDLIRVGGDNVPAVEVTDHLTLHFSAENREVGIGLPGLFASGEDPESTYDYVGEPVYIKNRGKWVQDGVIEDIMHEEDHTALVLGYGHWPDIALNHPDRERREQYRQKHAPHFTQDCPHCETEIRLHGGLPDAIDCPECGERVKRDHHEDEAVGDRTGSNPA